jgi:hypothetical protein
MPYFSLYHQGVRITFLALADIVQARRRTRLAAAGRVCCATLLSFDQQPIPSHTEIAGEAQDGKVQLHPDAPVLTEGAALPVISPQRLVQVER